MNGRSATAPGAPLRRVDGDIEFDEIWQYRDELREMCQRIVGDPALADDLVQETYLQALKNLHRLERRDGLMPWLVTVAKRRSLNELRRQRYSTPVETLPERPTTVELDPCEVVSVTDEVVRVQGVLDTLTSRERDLLMRQVYGGFTLEQLAEEEATTAASVRSVLSRARAKIRAAVADAGAAVLAPVGFITGWARNRLAGYRMRLADPVTPAAASRFGEVVTAGVASLALGVTTGIVPALPGSGDDGPKQVEVKAGLPGDPGEGSSGEGAGSSGTDPGAGGVPRGRVRSARTGSGGESTAAHGTDPTGSGTGAGSDPVPQGEDGPVPNPDAPEPPDAPVEPPVDADDPLPSAEEPEDASYQQFSAPSSSSGSDDSSSGSDESGNGGGGSGGGGGGAGSTQAGGPTSPHVFALGTTLGKCHVQCTALFHSDDAGATWERLPASGLTGTSLMVPPDYPRDSRIYAAGPTGLQVSLDGGRNFEQVLKAAHPGHAAMSPRFSSGDDRILIGARPSAWEYDAAADSSSPVTNGPPANGDVRFAFGPHNRVQQRVFASVLTTGPEGTEAAVHACKDKVGKYVCFRHSVLEGLTSTPSLYVSSQYREDGLVFAYADGGVFRSDDHGSNFSPIDLPFPHVAGMTDDGAGTFYAAGWDQTADGTVGGVAESSDGGLTWTLLGNGTRLAKGVSTVQAIGGGRLLAAPLASAGGGMLCSADAGATWHPRCPT